MKASLARASEVSLVVSRPRSNADRAELRRGARADEVAGVAVEAPSEDDVEACDEPGHRHDDRRDHDEEQPSPDPELSSESVSHAVHGRDFGRLLEVLELAPQPGDVRVERVLADDRAVRPAGADEVAAPHRLAGGREELREQAELGRRQRARPSRPSPSECVSGSSRSPPDSSAPSEPPRRRSAWSRATSSTNANGFVEVVVAACVEAGDAIDDRVAGGQEEHRRLRRRARGAPGTGRARPRPAGRCRSRARPAPTARRASSAFAPVAAGVDREALLAEPAPEHAAQLARRPRRAERFALRSSPAVITRVSKTRANDARDRADQPSSCAGRLVLRGGRDRSCATTVVTGTPRCDDAMRRSRWSQLETLCGSVERMISWNSPSCSASSMASMGSCRYETEPSAAPPAASWITGQRELEHALSVGLAVLPLGLGQSGVLGEVRDQEVEARRGRAPRARGLPGRAPASRPSRGRRRARRRGSCADCVARSRSRPCASALR